MNDLQKRFFTGAMVSVTISILGFIHSQIDLRTLDMSGIGVVAAIHAPIILSIYYWVKSNAEWIEKHCKK